MNVILPLIWCLAVVVTTCAFNLLGKYVVAELHLSASIAKVVFVALFFVGLLIASLAMALFCKFFLTHNKDEHKSKEDDY